MIKLFFQLPAPIWNPDPVILEIGSWQLRWYGLIFAFGFMAGYFLMRHIIEKEGVKGHNLDSLLTHVILGTIIGARLGHCLFYDPEYYFSSPLEILWIHKGGLASHGGALGVFIAVWLYGRKHREAPLLWLLDRMTVPVSLVAVMIRLGNFVNSEITGKPTEGPFGIIFSRNAQGEVLHAVHPTMLYEAAAYLVTFFFLLVLRTRLPRGQAKGILLGWMLTLVFGTRFFIEFTKAPQEFLTTGWPLSMGQILSLPMIMTGLCLLYRARRADPLPHP